MTKKKTKLKKYDNLSNLYNLNKSNNNSKNNIKDKPLFCVEIDLSKLTNESFTNKEKTNKKFKFSKSTKKMCYKDININDFSKDFIIIPNNLN